MCLRLAGYRRDGDDIARLRARLERLVSVMGLSASVRISEQVEDVRQLLVSAGRGGGDFAIVSPRTM